MKNTPKRLEAKPDWPQAVKRWKAFWKDEVPEDRVLMSIQVPREKNPYSEPSKPKNLEEFHTDLDFFLSNRLHEVFSYHYLAEAIPSIWNSITGEYLGILLGGQLKAMDNGVIKSKPYIDNWDDINSLQVDRSSKWYQISREQISLLTEHNDKFLIRIPDFHGISDALSSIRGPEQLIYDLMDIPDKIHWACSQVLDAWVDAYDEVYNILKDVQYGNVIWIGMWYPGKIEAIQEDFCELISEKHYNDFFKKYDNDFAKNMDCAMFHLHNTMTRYQNEVLDMPAITGTQFRLPYDEKRKPEPIKNHLELFNKMHSKGKKTWYSPINENDMKNAILNSDPRHLFLLYNRCSGLDEAKRIIDKACNWTQQRKDELGI